MRAMQLTDDEVRMLTTYRTLSEDHRELLAEMILELAAPEVETPGETTE